jgi:transcription elongation factor GreB
MKYMHGTPKGEKNYITPKGLKKLQDEFQKLKYEERPKVVEVVHWAAGNGDRSENGDYIYGKKRLREIDKRLEFLLKRLDVVEVVDPTTITVSYVAIGATVSVQDDDGNEKVYQIVGADESDPDKGKISWVSPIARALLKAKVDDYVTFKTPSGEKGLEIISIEYKEID